MRFQKAVKILKLYKTILCVLGERVFGVFVCKCENYFYSFIYVSAYIVFEIKVT